MKEKVKKNQEELRIIHPLTAILQGKREIPMEKKLGKRL